MSRSYRRSQAFAPFRLGVLPRDAFIHSTWERALQECVASLAQGGRILLYGAPGTGKTLLLQALSAQLRATGRTSLLAQYDVPTTAIGAEILLVDEADRLSDEELRRLWSSGSALVLAGLPGLRERLAGCVGLVGSVGLDPLSASDIDRLVGARLEAAGQASARFTPDAVLALARQSGGLFRLVMILAGAALFFAELRGASIVTAADIDEAAAMREVTAAETEASTTIAPTMARKPQWATRLAVGTVMVVAALGAAVHLSAHVGGPAAAAAEAGPVSGSAEPLRPTTLRPKRPLTRTI